jgi:hypothetical protein
MVANPRGSNQPMNQTVEPRAPLRSMAMTTDPMRTTVRLSAPAARPK